MILFRRRFFPLFCTQFFGAFNDNFFKNSLLIFVTYYLLKNDASKAGTITNLAAALFILPYFLLSSIAGELSDKYPRHIFILSVKIFEVILMIGAAIGFYLQNVSMLLVFLFLMGVHSTFFGPAKYSVLPDLLVKEELLSGNTWIGAGTYLAILTGTIGGERVFDLPDSTLCCGAAMILIAVLGVISACTMPKLAPAAPGLKPDWNIFRGTWVILRDAIWHQKEVMKCILSCSTFWMAASIYVTQIALYTKNELHGGREVSTFFFVIFSIGIGIGAFISGKLFKKDLTDVGGKCTVIAIAGMALCTLDLALHVWIFQPAQKIILTECSQTLLHASLDFLLIAVFGGIWSVPMQAKMQSSSDKAMLSRTIAGNNIINSIFMVLGAAWAGGLMFAGCSTLTVWIVLAAILFLSALASALVISGKNRTGESL